MMEAIQRVRNLEAELEASRKVAGRSLRSARRRLKMTLRQVASGVSVSAATVHNTEKNKAWNTETASELARYYEKQLAA